MSRMINHAITAVWLMIYISAFNIK